MLKIWKNRVQCTNCQEIITSTYRHDFVRCGCGTIFTDGGQEYIRRGGNFNYMNDLDEYFDDETGEIFPVTDELIFRIRKEREVAYKKWRDTPPW